MEGWLPPRRPLLGNMRRCSRVVGSPLPAAAHIGGMTTSVLPETVLAEENRSRSIKLEAPVPGTDHGLVHFSWSLDDGEDKMNARYAYWVWPDARVKGARRYSHGYRNFMPHLPPEAERAGRDLWASWVDGAPEPEGTVRRFTRLIRSYTVTGMGPFTTFRNETYIPALARVMWVREEEGGRAEDFCTVTLAPAGTLPSWEAASWTHSPDAGSGEYFNGDGVIPDWLAGLAVAARADLLGTKQ